VRAPRAILWDVDGTIAETERDGHRVAFNLAFEALGLPWRWDEARYGELLRITGGRERLIHDMQTRPDAPHSAQGRDALARDLHARKNRLYAALVADVGIPLRGGVLPLMDECAVRGVQMAITTTTSLTNVDALLGKHLGRDWGARFSAIVCGEDVAHKKPDPEVFHLALQQLAIDPSETLAIEDSPGGVAAACSARCPVIATRSIYFADEPVQGAIAVGPGLHTRAGWSPTLTERPGSDSVCLDDLAEWLTKSGSVHG
jgi:HAD superfamily hydrolase (TIGR01509 family)